MHSARSVNPRRKNQRVALLALALLQIAVPVAAPVSSASAATLERIREAGKMTIGYRADARPFSFKDDAGNPDGFAITLCRRIADDVKARLGLASLPVDFVPLETGNVAAALQSGQIDLFCTPVIPTLSRREDVSFSIPVFRSGTAALLKRDSSQKLKDILSGRDPPDRPKWRADSGRLLQTQVFTVVKGSVAEQVLTNRLRDLALTSKVVLVDDFPSGVQAVLDGKANVFFGEHAVLLETARRGTSADKLTVLDYMFTHDSLALAVARNDDDFRLLVDRSLSEQFRSPQIGTVYGNYFGKATADALSAFSQAALPQ